MESTITKKNPPAEKTLEEIHRAKWLTVSEASRYYKMSKKTLMKYIKLGRIVGHKLGDWLINRESSDEMIKNTDFMSLKS